MPYKVTYLLRSINFPNKGVKLSRIGLRIKDLSIIL